MCDTTFLKLNYVSILTAKVTLISSSRFDLIIQILDDIFQYFVFGQWAAVRTSRLIQTVSINS